MYTTIVEYIVEQWEPVGLLKPYTYHRRCLFGTVLHMRSFLFGSALYLELPFRRIQSIARKCSCIEMGSIVDSTSAAAAAAATVREKAITAAGKARETTRRSAGHRAGIKCWTAGPFC
jgi:hypothetical protein